jgi:hypothetical protein
MTEQYHIALAFLILFIALYVTRMMQWNFYVVMLDKHYKVLLDVITVKLLYKKLMQGCWSSCYFLHHQIGDISAYWILNVILC